MSKYESPDYKIKLKEGDFELRAYKDFYIVEYENASDPDLNYGFGTLFRYISKSNDRNEKISMTIPVIKEVTERGLKMAFVVPQSYWNNIPHPNDEKLKIGILKKAHLQRLLIQALLRHVKNIGKLNAWVHGLPEKI